MCIDLFSIGPVTIHGYGLMIGLGFLAAILFGCLKAKKEGLSDNDFINIAIYVLIFGFMGGKLLYLIVNFKRFLETPLDLLKSQGFVVYGGVITGIISIFVYCKVKKISFLKYVDILAPAVALNQAFGRIGCFLAGCCYGRETDSAIGVIFPEHSIAPSGVKLLPTQLFMSAGDFILFIFLVIIYKKVKKDGMVAGLYLLLYSIGRIIVEFFRADYERGYVGVMSTSQFIGVIISILAIIYMILISKKNNHLRDDGGQK